MSVEDKQFELLGFGYVREIFDDDIPSDVVLIIIEFAKLFIDSVILSPEEQRCLAKLIEVTPQTAKFKNCEWKLLCRGSRDGEGDYHAFHRLCDGKKNTVCLLDLNEGFVCGGYASSAWESTDHNTKCKDDNAFLFTLRPSDKRKVFHRKRDKDGKLLKQDGGILFNRVDGFNFGYNDFFWGDYDKIPCSRLYIRCQNRNHFDVESDADLCGISHDSYGRCEAKFKEFEVFQLIQK